MKGNPEERAVRLGEYIVATGATVRTAAERFGISKSTVHKDVTTRLRCQNQELFREVQQVLDRNKAERHLRGARPPKKNTTGYKNSGGERSSPPFCDKSHTPPGRPVL